MYATRAVRDLLMVLRAADDPTDHLRIVSALRTPLLGCGDDDLFRHKVLEGRTWSYNTPTPPDPADGIVVGRAWPSCSRSTRAATGARPPSCSTASPAIAAPSSSASPRAGRATCGGGSAS